jgi:flagellar hook protein FlgE
MSFQQGLSGLNATSKNLEVIGNNVANAQTYGEKASRAEFADMYASAMTGGGGNSAGIGVTVSAVTQQMTQGNITSTSNPMDLAINGSGFFQVTDGKGQTLYSRNGQFNVDREGKIASSSGLQLMGYPADANGVIQPGESKALEVPTAGISPKSTTAITMEANLDSRLATTLPAPPAAAINFADATTYNNATSQTLYDAKGQEVAMTYYFQKAGNDTWNVYGSANGTSVNTDSSGKPSPLTTITFEADGSKPITPTGLVNVDIPATTNAAGASALAISGVTFDVKKSTQFGSQFGTTDLTQDGFAPGQRTGVVLEDNGMVMVKYSNGQSKPAGQIQLANFRNAQGLQPMGGNAWARSYASGDPIIGSPGDGNLGVLQSGALEESNVDLTAELVSMITAQRVYQANAQTIKTQDQALQTLVNLR